MKAIIGGRGTGRTWKLLQEASKENGLVVCHSIASADYTMNMAIEMYRKGKLKSVPEIVWYVELIGNNSRGGNRSHTNKINKKLFIDNVECVLSEMFHGDIGKFVVCDDEEHNKTRIGYNFNGLEFNSDSEHDLEDRIRKITESRYKYFT